MRREEGKREKESKTRMEDEEKDASFFSQNMFSVLGGEG